MARIVIELQANEKDALYALARNEYRELRSQAAFIIRQELERLGLLSQESTDLHKQQVGSQLSKGADCEAA